MIVSTVVRALTSRLGDMPYDLGHSDRVMVTNVAENLDFQWTKFAFVSAMISNSLPVVS